MIKRLLSLIVLMPISLFLAAQNNLVTFEAVPVSATSFDSGTRTFNITSQAGGTFMIRQFTNAGWNGTGVDHRFIDNPGAQNNVPIKFTITANGSFNLKQFYLYLSDNTGVGVNDAGTLRIIGKQGATEVFNLFANAGFNTSGSNNGYTLINFATFGGSNNQTKVIDRFEVETTGNFEYVALDAMTWSLPVTLPVSFGDASAKIQSGRLQVNWTTLSETNNDRFIVQGSNDGKIWTDWGIVASKAIDGRSSSKLSYQFSMPWEEVELAGLGILGLLLLPASRSRLFRLAILLIVISTIVSCSKENDSSVYIEKHTAGLKPVYLRIAQIDRDGTVSYSETLIPKK